MDKIIKLKNKLYIIKPSKNNESSGCDSCDFLKDKQSYGCNLTVDEFYCSNNINSGEYLKFSLKTILQKL